MADKLAAEKDQELRLGMIKRGYWKSCMNCEHWQMAEAGVGQPGHMVCWKYGVTPPYEIIMVGCVEHVKDVPF